ncbi:unnamed protein product [Polarella glacialis]|uniref:Pseudouridine synthase RsuA/RluA-like domain-containing protein n=1 Tax=Polarella glacialis TaxID=89957 RepID=A0A813IRV2_POLGL|nr:unnamed protein product [Polarella glacialis]CAE8655618.1 unnamed protein product [Polarella glacialis]
MKRSASPMLQSQQIAVPYVSHFPKEALTHAAQARSGRGLVKGDVVYTTVDTGSGYVAMCSFSAELSIKMGIDQGVKGAVAENPKAAEHNAASAVLSVLGVECGPKRTQTQAPIQSPWSTGKGWGKGKDKGWGKDQSWGKGPPSSAKTSAPKAKNAPGPCRVFAVFKPAGMLCTMSTDPSTGGGDFAAWINSILPGSRLSVIGGLDKNASGLLLVTNDGPFAASVTASHGCEKEYWCGVDVASDVDAYAVVAGTCAQLLGGFELPHPTKPTKVMACAKDARQLLPEEEAAAMVHAGLEGAATQGTRLLFSVTMDTGSGRVPKSMLQKAGVPCVTQHLERIGSLRLADLQLWQPGSHVELSSDHLEQLRNSCSLGPAA